MPGDVVERALPGLPDSRRLNAEMMKIGTVMAVVPAGDVAVAELNRTNNFNLHACCPLWWVWWSDGSMGLYVDHHIRHVRDTIPIGDQGTQVRGARER